MSNLKFDISLEFINKKVYTFNIYSCQTKDGIKLKISSNFQQNHQNKLKGEK